MTPGHTTAALWPYALEIYGRPGVEALLLRLQDEHGQCVPFLLWSLWMAATGRPVDAATTAACAELARAWQDAAVAPLRRLRRGLKAKASPKANHERLQARIRTGVQALELEAERMLLQMLEESSPAPAGAQTAADAALAQAVRAWGGEAPPALLLQQLAALCA